mmetsp:Transcript_77757/g.137820  ORF Transcript_77757/g.137820 Transcript_77757/m.137820 type:complete len:694 (+) Transcript_77757:91-2172(+)
MACSILVFLLLACVSTAAAGSEDQEQCAMMQTRNIRQQKILQTDRQDQCVHKILTVGVGYCMDGPVSPDSLGWSKSTCGNNTEPSKEPCIASCPSAEVCGQECLENPECGGFQYAHLHCWLFKTFHQPNVKYNDPHTWYTCYKKSTCCPGQCCLEKGFKTCNAFGDPHFTQSFFTGSKPFDSQKIGLFSMASNKDASFELQSFQCPYTDHTKGISVFVAFAMKVGGHTITIVGSNVTINGSAFPGGKHASGLNVRTVYEENDKVEFDAPDNCIHCKIKKIAHSAALSGYFQNFQMTIADEVASDKGICGTDSAGDPLPANKSLFTDFQLGYLCGMCGIKDCESMTPPDDWVPVNGSHEVCEKAGINISDAEQSCEALKNDESHFKACVFDYCASGGNEDVVNNAVETKQEEEEQAEEYNQTTLLEKCNRPYTRCTAWGDPHYTATFFGGQFDFQNLGVFKLASSSNGKFELQAFQCPFHVSVGSVFAGFAMNVGGDRITVVKENVTINGRLFKGSSHASGLKIEDTRKPRDTVHLDTLDSCVHLKVSSHDWKESPGHSHDLFLEMAASVATAEGVCGSNSTRPSALGRGETLFDASELNNLCRICQMTDCVHLTPDSAWSPSANVTEACKAAGVSMDDATKVCKKTVPHQETVSIYLEDCVFDYCASGGDQEAAEVAAESLEEVVGMDVVGSV